MHLLFQKKFTNIRLFSAGWLLRYNPLSWRTRCSVTNHPNLMYSSLQTEHATFRRKPLKHASFRTENRNVIVFVTTKTNVLFFVRKLKRATFRNARRIIEVDIYFVYSILQLFTWNILRCHSGNHAAKFGNIQDFFSVNTMNNNAKLFFHLLGYL